MRDLLATTRLQKGFLIDKDMQQIIISKEPREKAPRRNMETKRIPSACSGLLIPKKFIDFFLSIDTK